MFLALPSCQSCKNRKLNFANRRWYCYANRLKDFAAYSLCSVLSKSQGSFANTRAVNTGGFISNTGWEGLDLIPQTTLVACLLKCAGT